MIFNSLKIKIVGLVAVFVIAVISIMSWLHYYEQKMMVEQVIEKSSVVLIESVVSNIQNAMRTGHSESLSSILTSVKSRDYIKELRIVNDQGKILHSADITEVGQTLPVEDWTRLQNNKDNHFYFLNTKNEFDSYTKIKNLPECHRCHDPARPHIAYIETEIYLGSLISYIDSEKQKFIISSTIMIIIIIGVLFLFLSIYVDRPFRSLINSMQEVEQGNFEISNSDTSSNEMTLLSDHFNMMTSKLRKLMETSIMSERELTRAEEKLSHHHETHIMNQKLEEQLGEIESLNIAMEERLEEVEKANFTIADLASELENKNRNLESLVDHLSTIYKIGLAINSTMDIDRLFNLIVRTTSTTLKAHIGYVILYDKEMETLNVTNLIGNGKLLAPHKSIPMSDRSVSTWVINNRQPLLIGDIGETPQFDVFSALGYERKTLICVPLIVKDEIIGTISVVNKIDNTRFCIDEMEMLTTIAAQAAIAIKNATLYEEQQQTYLNTIQALVSAVEASDSYTRGHSERVTRYSLEIGRRMNMSSDRLQILERAAILHDIGKIGIDLSLLHKEGKLTSNDINQLHQHPMIGVKILEPIGFLIEVRKCIAQHHERYDGKGYPNRIQSNEMLIESRILSVADAFDAMTSDRPYRKALPLETAIQELIDNSGSQFDPAIVDVFTSFLEEGGFVQPYINEAPQGCFNSTLSA